MPQQVELETVIDLAIDEPSFMKKLLSDMYDALEDRDWILKNKDWKDLKKIIEDNKGAIDACETLARIIDGHSLDPWPDPEPWKPKEFFMKLR
jgi:hypothetical protein